MNVTAGNTTIICETQSLSNNREITQFPTCLLQEWNRCYKASSCSVSITANMEREVVCKWRYNESTVVTVMMPTGRAKLKPSKSIPLPPRLLIRLFKSHLHRFLKIDPFPSNRKVGNKCYLIFRGPLNEWNYQCRLNSLQVNLLTYYVRWLLWLHGQTPISPK